jgi:putative hemolysin
MDTAWIEAFAVLFLIALVGFFSAGEVAVLSSRKSRMQELAEEGNKKAALVLGFLKDPERFLATVHVGSVFSLVLASGISGILGLQHLVPAFQESSRPWLSEGSTWISLAVIVAGIGFLVVVFGELVPKSLALRHAEAVSLWVATPLSFCATAFWIPARLLTLASNVVLRPFKDSTTFRESRISEEEFKLLLEEGTRTGVIDKTEQELIGSIFEFTDTTAKEVMIPRTDVVALNIEMPRERLIKTVLEEGYSRMPVYRGTIDTILGVIYTKDLLGLMEYRDIIIIHDIIRPAYFVPETTKISRLLRDLQSRKMHMAIVMDEFGGTEGIVTMEDILEEIVGEIHDEYDEEHKDVEQTGEGAFVLNGRTSIRDFNERFATEIPLADEYETISGLLHKLAGRIPDVGEEIVYKAYTFSIIKKSQTRIKSVKMTVKENAAGDPQRSQPG